MQSLISKTSIHVNIWFAYYQNTKDPPALRHTTLRHNLPSKAEVNRNAAERDEATLYVFREYSGSLSSCENGLTTLLSSQQTGLAWHEEPEPKPIAVIGLQLKPSKALGLLKATPSAPRMAVPEVEFAYRFGEQLLVIIKTKRLTACTSLQHWTLPTLQLSTGPVAWGAATAKAAKKRTGRAVRTNMASLDDVELVRLQIDSKELVSNSLQYVPLIYLPDQRIGDQFQYHGHMKHLVRHTVL